MGEVLSIAVFGPDGRYLKDVTPSRVDPAILAGLAHPQYSKIRAPALAIYAVADSAPEMFSNYAGLDSTGRAQAQRFYAAFSPWTDQERARFKREVAGGRVVEIRGAHHYVFMSNEAEVMREMRAFLSGD
jgi:pimeloyl-ACP methyl ester carboxylesterase